jgi:hypothetical protein
MHKKESIRKIWDCLKQNQHILWCVRRSPASAAADEFYNLDLCVSFHAHGVPIGFAHDCAVQFDGDALRVEAEMQEHLTDIQTSRDLALFAIHDNFNSESHV